MFTGIIEETGILQELRQGYEGAFIRVSAKKVPSDLKIGDSIAVNGVCLTTTQNGMEWFCCEISAETLRRTSFKNAKQGMIVNLERPLVMGSRLGGHFVLGHVDGTVRLIEKAVSGTGVEIMFDLPQELERYLVDKGSVAVDGISLTIASLNRSSFTVAVIPHTLEVTNLKRLKIGDVVNLEVDVLGKYFERFFRLGLAQKGNTGSPLTADYLKDQGY